jgi:hypothetical protein
MSRAHMSVSAADTGAADPRQSRYDRRRFLYLMTAGVGSTLLLGASGCQGPFALGYTKPFAVHTGLQRPTTLTSVGGPLTLSLDNQVFKNVRFERLVSVAARNVTFRNCAFVGPPNPTYASGEQRLVNCQSAKCAGIVFDRCVFRPQMPHQTISTGVFGHDFVAHRCDISRMVDGVGVDHPSSLPANVLVAGCYIHDLVFYSPHPTQSDNRSHSDGSQSHPNGHRNITWVGNNIQAFIDTTIGDYEPPVFDGSGNLLSGYPYFGFGRWALSSIMLGADTNLIENVLIDRNWINGGHWAINCGNHLTASNFQVINNRWGRKFMNNAGTGNDDTNWGIKKTGLTTGLTTSGNTYEDNGAPNNTWKPG